MAASRPGGRTARVRARTFEATVELIARDGVTGFGYDEVAERAGVHRTSVYRNWPDRGALVVEALAAYAEQGVPFADTGDLRADLIELLLAYAATLDTPLARALSAVIRGSENENVIRAVRGVLDRRIELIGDRLTRAADRGELPTVDPLFFAYLTTGPVQMYVTRRERPFTRSEAERVADVVLAGLRAT